MSVSPRIGGKLETGDGESPHACAVREIREEAGLDLDTTDVHLTGIVAETAYEGEAHWLLFLFEVKRAVGADEIASMEFDEGRLEWVPVEQVADMDIPETDRNVEILASQNVPLVAFVTPDWSEDLGKIGLWYLVARRLVVPPEGTGTRTVISHLLRRHALEERTATSVSAGQLATAMARGARACIFPRTVFEEPNLPAQLKPLPRDLGSVQISVVRLSGVPLSRPSQCLLRHVERRLNAEL